MTLYSRQRLDLMGLVTQYKSRLIINVYLYPAKTKKMVVQYNLGFSRTDKE